MRIAVDHPTAKHWNEVLRRLPGRLRIAEQLDRAHVVKAPEPPKEDVRP
jgi:hypothetical protein